MSRNQDTTNRLREAALDIFHAGVRAADPRRAVQNSLEIAASGQPVIAGEEVSRARSLRIVALGKASVLMAEAALEMLPAELFRGPGVVAVNPENYRDLEHFEVYASGHPVPDAAGVSAARAVERYLTDCSTDDALLVLVSGGGSALLPAPAPGISLEDKIETTRLLLASGEPIQQVNTVRKHLSTLKAGGMARQAYPARLEAVILSDVIGDDLSSIASGPTAPDPTTFADAEEVLAGCDPTAAIPASVRERIDRGVRGEIADTPTADDPAFSRVVNRVVGSNSQSLAAARSRAAALGFEVMVLPSPLLGEARDAAAIVDGANRENWTGDRPLAVLAGGETTVSLKGRGSGGRNQEMALAFALLPESRNRRDEWVFLSGATDGRDGPTDAAGGMVDTGTLDRIRSSGLDPAAELDENNSYVVLRAAGDLLMTGSTGTNVADLQVLLLSRGRE